MNCKTINKTIKQMLAMLLAVAMVATSFSVPVKAAEGEDPIDESIVVAEETVEETAVESDQSVENTEITEEGEQAPIEEEPAVEVVEAVEETAVEPEEAGTTVEWDPTATGVIGVAPGVDKASLATVTKDNLLTSDTANTPEITYDEDTHTGTITITPKENSFRLKSHEGDGNVVGYWAGVYFKAPKDATGYSYKKLSSEYDTTSDLKANGKLDGAIDNPNSSNQGAVYYLNLGASKVIYYALQWTGGSDTNVYVFKIDMSAIKIEEADIAAATNDDVMVAESVDKALQANANNLLNKNNAQATLEGTTITVTKTAQGGFEKLASHQNELDVKGYWAGVAIKAPENKNITGYRYGFLKSASDTNYKLSKSNLDTVYNTENYGAAIYFDLGASMTNYVALQWVTDTGAVSPTTIYTVDMRDIDLLTDDDYKWIPSTTEGSANICVAPSVDKTSGSPEAEGMLSDANATAAYSNNTITITNKDANADFVLCKHKNDQNKAGYWAGVALKAPENTTGYRVALLSGVSDDSRRNYMKSPELDIVNNEKKYATIYLELGTSKKQAIAIKWIKEDGSVSPEYILDIDMTAIKIPADVTYTPSTSTIYVAPSVDYGSKVDTGLLNATNATLGYAADTKVVSVTPKDASFKLNKHKNSNNQIGHWAGVLFEAPAGVDGYKAAASKTKIDASVMLGEKSGLDIATYSTGASSTKEVKGASVYLDLNSSKTGYFALQWMVGNEAIGNPDVYKLDFSKVNINEDLYKVTASVDGNYFITKTTAIADLQAAITKDVKKYTKGEFKSVINLSKKLQDETDELNVPFVWSRAELPGWNANNNNKNYYLAELVDKDGKALNISGLTADADADIYVKATKMVYLVSGDKEIAQDIETAKLTIPVKKGLTVTAKDITFVKSSAATEANLREMLNPSIMDDGKAVTSTATANTIFWKDDTSTKPTSGNYFVLSSTYSILEESDGQLEPGDTKTFNDFEPGNSYEATITAKRYVKASATAAYTNDATVTTTCTVKIVAPASPAVEKDGYTVTQGTTLKQLQNKIGTKISVDGKPATIHGYTFWSDDTAFTTSVTAGEVHYVLDLRGGVTEIAAKSVGAIVTGTLDLYKYTPASNTYNENDWKKDANKMDSVAVSVTVVNEYKVSILGYQAGVDAKGAKSITVSKGLKEADFKKFLNVKAYVYDPDSKVPDSENEEEIDHYATKTLSPAPVWYSAEVMSAELAANGTKYVISASQDITDSVLAGNSIPETTITITKYHNGDSTAKATSSCTPTIKESVRFTATLIDNGNVSSVGFDASISSEIGNYITLSYKSEEAMTAEIKAALNGKVSAVVATSTGTKTEKPISKAEFDKKKKNDKYPEGKYYVWDVTYSYPTTAPTSKDLDAIKPTVTTVTVSYYDVAKGGEESPAAKNSANNTLGIKVTPADGFIPTGSDGYKQPSGATLTLYKATPETLYSDIKDAIRNADLKAWENAAILKRNITLTGKPASVKGKKAGQVLGYAYEITKIAGLTIADTTTETDILEAIGKASSAISVAYDIVSYVAAEETVSGKTSVVAVEGSRISVSNLEFSIIAVPVKMYEVTLQVKNAAEGKVLYWSTVAVENGTTVIKKFPADANWSKYDTNGSVVTHTTTEDYSKYTWTTTSGEIFDLYTTPVNDDITIVTYELVKIPVKEVGTGENAVTYSIQAIPDQTYTGKNITPIVEVYEDDTPITTGYSVVYKQNNKSVKPKNAGTYNVYVTIGKGKSAINLNPVTFTITRRNIGDWSTTNTFADQSIAVKAGQKGTLGLIKSFKANGIKLSLGSDYEYAIVDDEGNVKYQSTSKLKATNLSTGSYTIYVTTLPESANFVGNKTFTRKLYVNEKGYILKNAKVKFTGKAVLQKDGTLLPVTITFADKKTSVTYDPVNEVSGASGTINLPNGESLSIEYSNYKDAGKATVTITADAGNTKYTGATTATYKISAAKGKKLAKGMIAKKSDLSLVSKQKPSYKGSAWTLEDLIKIVNSDKTLTDDEAREIITKSMNGPVYGRDFTVSYSKNVNAGKATVKFNAVNGSGYTGSFSITFKIGKVDLNDGSLTDVTDKYDGMTLEEVRSEDSDYFMLSEAKDKYVLTRDAIENLIDDDVTGYPLVNNVDYTISYKNNSSKTVKANNKNMTITIKGKGNYQGKQVITIVPSTAE